MGQLSPPQEDNCADNYSPKVCTLSSEQHQARLMIMPDFMFVSFGDASFWRECCLLAPIAVNFWHFFSETILVRGHGCLSYGEEAQVCSASLARPHDGR